MSQWKKTMKKVRKSTAAIFACKEGGIGVEPLAEGVLARRPVKGFLEEVEEGEDFEDKGVGRE
jgi:hypothetical protein